MIVVTNRIPVAEGHEIDFEERFKTRAHLVALARAGRARPVDEDRREWVAP